MIKKRLFALLILKNDCNRVQWKKLFYILKAVSVD